MMNLLPSLEPSAKLFFFVGWMSSVLDRGTFLIEPKP